MRLLAQHGWLSRQPESFCEQLFELGDVHVLPKGGAIYSLGDPHGGLYGLAQGFVDVLIAPGPFAPQLVHVAGPGWWIGDSALITRTPRPAASG